MNDIRNWMVKTRLRVDRINNSMFSIGYQILNWNGHVISTNKNPKPAIYSKLTAKPIMKPKANPWLEYHREARISIPMIVHDRSKKEYHLVI